MAGIFRKRESENCVNEWWRIQSKVKQSAVLQLKEEGFSQISGKVIIVFLLIYMRLREWERFEL